MAKRLKTNYPGVFYFETKRRGGGTEKVYYVVFKKGGRVYEEKAGRQYEDGMTPARASLYRAERVEGKRSSRKELRESEAAAGERLTVGRLWEEYKAQRAPKGLAQDKSRYKNYLETNFAEKQPSEILPLDVDRIRLSMLKGRKSKQHVKLTLALLKRICNFGERKGLCAGLSFQIEAPEVYNEQTEDLTQEQLKRLLEAIEKDAHPMAGDIMKMALFTGMRRGELFKLEWRDVDFEKGFIQIRGPKGGPDQTIPMNDQARRLLEAVPFRDSPYVFPGRGGLERKEIRQVREICKAAGLPEGFRPLHGLRHVYASMLASSGKVDMYTLQKLLTHKSPTMTQRYAHLRDNGLRRASSLAGTIISEASNPKKKGKQKKVVKIKKT